MIDFERGAPGFQGGGSGISRDVVVTEFEAAGFELVSAAEVWPRGAYCVVFSRPVARPVT